MRLGTQGGGLVCWRPNTRPGCERGRQPHQPGQVLVRRWGAGALLLQTRSGPGYQGQEEWRAGALLLLLLLLLLLDVMERHRR